MIRGGGGGRRRDDTTTLETTTKTTTTRRTNNNNNAAENDDDDDDDGGVINVHQNLNNNNGNNDEYNYNNNGYHHHHHQHDNNNNTTRYHNNTTRTSTSTSLYDWMSKLFYNVLYSLGLKGKEGTILFLGLDNAGKTTLLHRLKSGGGGGTGHGNNKNDHNSSSSHMRSYPPTDRPNHDTFTISKIQFSAWDLGGHEVVRHMWEDFCISTNINAILFLIDAADIERLEEAGYELDALICSHNTSNNDDDDDHDYLLKNIPIAILFNKCDLSNAQSSSTICDKIDYERLVNIHSKQYLQLFRISVLQNEGYIDAFQWISTFL